MRHCVAVLIAVLWCASWSPAQSPADTVLQARAILKKNCRECHEQWKDKIANIADYRDITSRDHLFNQIIELVEDGSMPPKGAPLGEDEVKILKDWVKLETTQKPRPFPLDFNEAYTLQQIATHARTNKFPADVRYLALNVPDADGNITLKSEREGLQQALDRLLPAQSQGKGLSPIDGVETVFALKLKDIGWDEPVIHKVAVNPATKAETVQELGIYNPFDLLLLEYPIGFLDPNQTDYKALKPYFDNARMVRPFAYLSGDWLSHVSRSPQLREEFARLRKEPMEKPEPINDVALVVRATPGIKPGRILPIDGLLSPNLPDNPAFEIVFDLIDPKTKKSSRKFSPGEDAIIIKIGAVKDQNYHAELIWIDSDGRVDFVGLPGGGDVKSEPLIMPVKLGKQLGRERMHLFACKSGGQANAMLYGRGTEYRRFIHSFNLQKLPEDNWGLPPLFDRNYVVKKTIEFEIVK